MIWNSCLFRQLTKECFDSTQILFLFSALLFHAAKLEDLKLANADKLKQCSLHQDFMGISQIKTAIYGGAFHRRNTYCQLSFQKSLRQQALIPIGKICCKDLIDEP